MSWIPLGLAWKSYKAAASSPQLWCFFSTNDATRGSWQLLGVGLGWWGRGVDAGGHSFAPLAYLLLLFVYGCCLLAALGLSGIGGECGTNANMCISGMVPAGGCVARASSCSRQHWHGTF